MHTPAEAIATYVRAKDGNRPHLMAEAFAEAALLEMVVKTGAISFPPRSAGLQEITDVLVRRFGQTFENLYTLCLAAPPEGADREFACDWLVGMSEKVGGAVRVGCGRYDWRFAPTGPCLVQRLTITVELMEVLPPTTLAPVMNWLRALPYPWCPASDAVHGSPRIGELARIIGFIGT